MDVFPTKTLDRIFRIRPRTGCQSDCTAVFWRQRRNDWPALSDAQQYLICTMRTICLPAQAQSKGLLYAPAAQRLRLSNGVCGEVRVFRTGIHAPSRGAPSEPAAAWKTDHIESSASANIVPKKLAKEEVLRRIARARKSGKGAASSGKARWAGRLYAIHRASSASRFHKQRRTPNFSTRCFLLPPKRYWE